MDAAARCQAAEAEMANVFRTACGRIDQRPDCRPYPIGAHEYVAARAAPVREPRDNAGRRVVDADEPLAVLDSDAAARI
jgi:hypothetical protein